MATALTHPTDVSMPPMPLQRWWRLQGQARRCGRRVEPLLVTPRFLARLDSGICPVSRRVIASGAGQVVALRDDADWAAGHLVVLDRGAARPAPGRWQDAWATAERLAADGAAPEAQGLDLAAWRRLAVLRSFVQAPTPAEAAELPLLVLPPNRLRVLSDVQGLQVAMTLALALPDRARRLTALADHLAAEEQRLALRLFALTLVARRPTDLDRQAPAARRHALEDLWNDPLLQRRWRRLAQRLAAPDAAALLRRGHAAGLLGSGWRPLDDGWAIDGWAVAAPRGPVAPRRPRPQRAARSQSGDDCVDAAVAPPLVAGPVLGAVRGRDGLDADAQATAVA